MNPSNQVLMNAITETLDKILANPSQKDSQLNNQYLILLNKLSMRKPTADIINFGIRTMYRIFVAGMQCYDDQRGYLSKLATDTVAYFRFDERENES